MIAFLQLGLAPLVALVALLWASVVAMAAEGDPELPRALTHPSPDMATGSPRRLHVAHLGLLLLAGASGGAAIAWWAWPPAEAAGRFLTIVTLVWVVGDLLPRITASILPPDLMAPVRRFGVRSLAPFAPLYRLIDRLSRRPAAPRVRAAPGEAGMLAGVFALHDMTVAEVMTPRIDIVAVDRSAPLDAVIQLFRQAGYARLPVVDGHADAIAGVVYAKDLLQAMEEPTDGDWQSLIRPVSFVPEAKRLDRQLRDFLAGPSHLMIVVDEFGGTAGLVTLEDILEQIVGEIHDERDIDEVEPIQETGTGTWRVQGGVAVSDLEAHLGQGVGRDDVDTVGGLVLALLGRVPRVGDVVTANGVTLHVDQVVRRRVKRVTVSVDAGVET